VKHNPKLWLRHKLRLLNSWCAQGRKTYYRWEPTGMDATLRYPFGRPVDVKVAAAWDPGERPSFESPGQRAGWEILAVWHRRHGAWVDISKNLNRDQFAELGQQLEEE
jgi:hypothetical protein